jgi:uncharacterized membrane protein YsdA (DUF1294 family)
MTYVLLYLLAISLVTCAAFGLDKRAAMRGDWRIEERTLLLLAAVGGSPGAVLAQRIFRHKTKKQPFATWLLLIMALQAATVVALLWLRYR